MRGKKILIIEDDADMLALLNLILSRAGAEVLPRSTAGRGSVSLEFVSRI
jgi:DNA-binding response OmpR family regulator